MKDIMKLNSKDSKNVVQKPKGDPARWKRKPTPIGEVDTQEHFCRVLPFFIFDNFDFFMTLPRPKTLVKDREGYLLRIKKKIICQKAEF